MEAEIVSVRTRELVSRAASTVGHELVPQPFGEEGYQSHHVSELIMRVFEQADIAKDGTAVEMLCSVLTQRVGELSTSLDHIITIPHGINHVMRVDTLMTYEIPQGITSLQTCLREKYGDYAEVLTLLTALCHDLGYVRIAQSPIVFPAQIFGAAHCGVGAEVFTNEIAPLVRQALPSIPESYLEEVAKAIRDHDEKFSQEEPLRAEENPLLFLLLVADKSDRVGTQRLHILHQNEVFASCVFGLALCIQDYVKDMVEQVKGLEKEEIPAALERSGLEILPAIIQGFRILQVQLRLPPWYRDLSLVDEVNAREEDSLYHRVLTEVQGGKEVLELMLQRFQILHNIDRVRWDAHCGALESILAKIPSEKTLSPELKALAIGYLLDPFSPFGMYGTLYEDMVGFMGVTDITCREIQGQSTIQVTISSGDGRRVAERIQSGLTGLYIGNRELFVEVNET